MQDSHGWMAENAAALSTHFVLLRIDRLSTPPNTFDQGFDEGSAIRHSTTCRGRGIHFYGEWDSYCVRERRVTEIDSACAHRV